MNIIIMGASFDPPHKGHSEIVSYLLTQNVADQIWLVPAKKHAFSKSLTKESHRMSMLELFLKDFQKQSVRIEAYEFEKESTSYSYETIRYFAKSQQLNTFAWIIGSDNIIDFSKWYKYHEMLKEFVVYVYPRPNYPMEHLLKGMVYLNEAKEISVSSTEIRIKVKMNQSISDLVNPEIAKYIKENKLYKF